MKPAAIILGVLVFGWWVADLQVHWRAEAEFQHGWMVPILCAFLVWERIPRLTPVDPARNVAGPLALAGAATPLVVFAELYRHAIGSTFGATFCLSVGCCGFLLALVWLTAGGPAARLLLFPLLFMFVAVPIPKLVWNPLVMGLQSLITAANVEALNLLGIPAVRSGNVLHLPTGTVGVDEACSGVRSLQSSIMAALFIADLLLRRTSAKVFFLVAGIVLAIVGNFGRSLYLSLTASRQGVDAVQGVHDSAGWSVLLFTACSIALLAYWFHRAEQRARALPAPASGLPS